jgi:glutamate carboxypeptidase
MDMKDFLKRLVETESPSHDKSAVDQVGTIVAAEAEAIRAKVERIHNDQTGDHILCKWGDGAGGILLICHMDTVFPLGTLENMPYRETEEKIFGPGVLDMKAGIVICLSAMDKLHSSAGVKRSVSLLCTSDEEIGSSTSRKHIEELARGSELVLVFEPALPDGSLKTWRKGSGGFWVEAIGRAAHAGSDHEQGRNAIEEMAHQVLAIQKLTDYSKGTTLNVGVITGGIASNVVPEHVYVEVDVRVSDPLEWKRIETEIGNLKPVLEGTSLHINGGMNRPPMPFDAHMKTTFERAASIAAGIGMQLKSGGTGGVSDANFVAPLGIPVLDGMGAIGEGLHSDREFIYVDSLEQKRKLLMELITKW